MLKGILQVEMKACKAATGEQIKVLYSVVKVNMQKNTDYQNTVIVVRKINSNKE